MTPVQGDLRVVDDVASAFADLVVEIAPASIALSGGDTAEDAYKVLAARELDWSGIDVYFGDERYVPVDDADSNEGMARAVLLDLVDPHEIHSMTNAGPTIEAAADSYDALVAAAAPIDLVHLGLGPDGHTASLFPATDALAVRHRLVVPNRDELHPHPRLTFTYPALERSRLIVFTVTGEDKRDVFARVRAGDDLPAAHVTAEQVIWLVDPAAAG
jgi:6-phosphogluconolactonase